MKIWLSRIAVVVALLFVLALWAFAEEVDMSIIAQIESSSNPMAISYKGAKYGRGLCMISEICLKEYNELVGVPKLVVINKCRVVRAQPITKSELFISGTNLKIAQWYMNKRIPQMLRYYGVEDTVKNRLWAYNAGIGRVVNGIMPKETKRYIEKYKVAK